MNGLMSELRDPLTGRVCRVLSTATITVGGSCGLADAITSANTDSAASRASCRNVAAGTFVNIQLSTGPSWNCVDAGLTVNPGDRIRMLSMGQVP